MRLVDVYTHPEAEDLLWRLLMEREPYQSISHKGMPSLTGHLAFVRSKPYPHWYLIDCGELVGAVYLTKMREVGVGILKAFRGNGYGKYSVTQLLEKHPGPVLANINPQNLPSIKMFLDLGFQLKQVTYAHD
jgi:RimJ/RimL family protein N-acetyltransferase